jgi:hypothetical protein
MRILFQMASSQVHLLFAGFCNRGGNSVLMPFLLLLQRSVTARGLHVTRDTYRLTRLFRRHNCLPRNQLTLSACSLARLASSSKRLHGQTLPRIRTGSDAFLTS